MTDGTLQLPLFEAGSQHPPAWWRHSDELAARTFNAWPPLLCGEPPEVDAPQREWDAFNAVVEADMAAHSRYWDQHVSLWTCRRCSSWASEDGEVGLCRDWELTDEGRLIVATQGHDNAGCINYHPRLHVQPPPEAAP